MPLEQPVMSEPCLRTGLHAFLLAADVTTAGCMADNANGAARWRGPCPASARPRPQRCAKDTR